MHFQDHGIFVPAAVTGAVVARAAPVDGLTADASINASAALVNDGTASMQVCVRFTVNAPNGSTITSVQSEMVTVPAHGGTATTAAAIPLAAAELWSIPRPYQYVVSADILTDCLDGIGVVDEV